MKKILLSLFATGILLTGQAFASPSVMGPSGSINTPDANVLNEGKFSIGYNSLNDTNVTSANVGIAPNLEIGATFFNSSIGKDQSILNAKYAIIPEKGLTPGLSAGIIDATNEMNRKSYLVASKSFPLGFKASIGITSDSDNKVFGSIEQQIFPGLTSNTFPATTAKVEYDGKDYNYGLSIAAIPGAKIEVGSRNHDLYFGANFTFN